MSNDLKTITRAAAHAYELSEALRQLVGSGNGMLSLLALDLLKVSVDLSRKIDLIRDTM